MGADPTHTTTHCPALVHSPRQRSRAPPRCRRRCCHTRRTTSSLHVNTSADERSASTGCCRLALQRTSRGSAIVVQKAPRAAVVGANPPRTMPASGASREEQKDTVAPNQMHFIQRAAGCQRKAYRRTRRPAARSSWRCSGPEAPRCPHRTPQGRRRAAAPRLPSEASWRCRCNIREIAQRIRYRWW